MWNSSGKKIVLQGITVCLVSTVLGTVWCPGRFQTVSRGRVLVFFYRHSTRMYLMKEKQEGPIPMGLKRWPLKLVKHLANTTCVWPSPAGSAGCCSLNFLYLVNLKFRVRAPNGCCILEFRPNQSFVCNLLCTLRCKSQVHAKKTKCLSCLGRHFWNVLTPIHIIRDSYTKVFCWLNVFQGLVVKGIVKKYVFVFVMLMPSHSHDMTVTFGHMEFHLPIGFPLS